MSSYLFVSQIITGKALLSAAMLISVGRFQLQGKEDMSSGETAREKGYIVYVRLGKATERPDLLHHSLDFKCHRFLLDSGQERKSCLHDL